ncbi:MAG: YceD family protein [Rhodanobacteraceae bacterium]
MGSHKVDIGCLLAGGGRRLLVEQNVALEPFEGAIFPEPALARLELHAVDRLLEIDGTIDVDALGACDRCLSDVTQRMHVEVVERLEMDADGRTDPFGPSNVLTGDRLDVAHLAAQLVYSAMAPSRLCGEDCRGLCSACGENKNTDACHCASARLEITSGES